jgi:hypothetical protein
MKKSYILFLVFNIFIINVKAQTFVGGPISINTTWDLLGSPYIVQSNVAIMGGALLTILPGVEVRFDNQKSIQVLGSLSAIGIETLPIKFTSNNSSQNPGDWGYILFDDTSIDYNFQNSVGSIMRYCQVEYAGGAFIANNGAIRVYKAYPFIDNCLIQFNNEAGIEAWGLTNTLKISNCKILNSGIGIHALGEAPLNGTCEITNCKIESNFRGVYSTICDIKIGNNTIKNNSIEGINLSNQFNYISNNLIDSNAAGIKLDRCYGDTIINNTITNCIGDAVNIFNNQSSGHFSYIKNNTLKNNLSGIIITNNFGTAGIGCNIIDNIITDNFNYGVNCYTEDFSHYNTKISSNIISRNNIGISCGLNLGSFGASMSSSIDKNIVAGNTSFGIIIDDLFSYQYLICDSNIIADNGTQSVIGGGIYYNASKIRISNNSIINNKSENNSAIYASSDDTLIILNNTIAYNITTQASPSRSIYLEEAVNFNNNNICYNIGCSSPFYEVWNAGFQATIVNAQNCYWCSTNTQDIQNKIWDYFDDQNLGIVDPSNYLLTPNIDAPPTPPANLVTTQVGNDVTLSWSANNETDLLGYKVYWGGFTGYSFTNFQNAGNVTTFTITNASIADNFAVTSIDNLSDGINDMVEGHESWFQYPNADPCNLLTKIKHNEYSHLSVYPNPNSGTFSIETELKKHEVINLNLKNMMGQIIYSVTEKGNIGPYKKTLDINLKPGIYYLSLQTGEEIKLRKIEIIR